MKTAREARGKCVGSAWEWVASAREVLVEAIWEVVGPSQRCFFYFNLPRLVKLERGWARLKCISRESNPGHIDGNDVFYH